MIKPSSKLKKAVKLCDTAQYKIAIEVGLHPDALSKILNGAIRLKDRDPRLVAVGKILGLQPEECFELEAAAK